MTKYPYILGGYLRQSKFKSSSYSKVLNRLAPAIACSMTLVGVLGAVKCWLLPDLPTYFTSFLPKRSFSWKCGRVLISLTFSYFVLCSALLCSFVLSNCVCCMPMFVLLVHSEFTPGLSQSCYFTQNKFRMESHIPRFYRQLEILLNAFLNIYALMLLPTETFLTLAIISYNCCLILYRSYLNTVQLISICNGMILASSILTLVFEAGGKFNLYLHQAMVCWRRYPWNSRTRRLQMLRFAKSCRPLNFCYKGYRKIKQDTLLSLARSIAVNTFRVIKMLRK